MSKKTTNKNNGITEAPYDRKSINTLEKIFGQNCVTEKSETINKSIILKSALKGASKSGSGYGIPDSVVYLDNEYKNPFIFVEVKAPGQIDTAINDLLHYCKKVNEASIYIPFVLAVSGNEVLLQKFNKTTEQFQDVYIFDCSTNQKHALKIESVEEIEKYKEILNVLYLHDKDTYNINIPGFSQDEIVKFCVEVNRQIHAVGVKEGERATILTYFLICCLNKGFISKLDTNSFEDILLFSKSTFKSIVAKKNFTLNKNSFAILTDDELQDSEKSRYSQYVRGLEKIFDMIDIQIANDFKHLNLTRSLFVEKLIQSGNFLGDAYEVFHTYASGNDMGQYFTPRHAVDLMITVIEKIRGESINVNDVIYDPACGVGGFLCLAMKHATNGKTEQEKVKILEKLGSRIYGSEIEPLISDMARVNMLLRGDGKSGIVTGSSLDKDVINGLTPIKQLFAKNSVSPTLTLMNPPFPSDKSTFKSYEFIEHAIDVSADGAYIGAIIPVSVINGKKNFKEFRKSVLKVAELKAVITLPIDLFAPKAQIDTAIVVLKKSKLGHQDSNVYFASCNNDGLQMHKGKKQRISDYNTINDFQLLKNFWMNDKYKEVYEKFKFFNPIQQSKEYFEEGGEWSPYQWISDNPLSVEDSEIVRLSKFIQSEVKNAKEIKNLGGKW